MTQRRTRGTILGLVGVPLLTWGAIWIVNAWWLHAGMADARRAMARGDFKAAVERLALLLADRPGDGEAALLLGECYEVLGQPDAALDVWSRVPGHTASALQRGRLAIERGQLAVAERAARRRDRTERPRRETRSESGPARGGIPRVPSCPPQAEFLPRSIPLEPGLNHIEK